MKQAFGDTIAQVATDEANDVIHIAGKSTSAVNIAAAKAFEVMRRKNTNNVPFEAPDVFMYNVHFHSIALVLQQVKRALRLTKTWLPFNKYYAADIITSLGLDYNDLVVNRAEWLSLYNDLVTKVNSFYIPANIPLLERQLYLVSNLFKDEESRKFQTYAFKFPLTYVWNGYKYTTGTCLEPYELFTGRMTVTQFKNWCETISATLQDADLQIISANYGLCIKEGWNEGHSFSQLLMDDQNTVEILADDSVLEFIHNVRCPFVGNQFFGTASSTITEDYSYTFRVDHMDVEPGDIVQIPAQFGDSGYAKIVDTFGYVATKGVLENHMNGQITSISRYWNIMRVFDTISQSGQVLDVLRDDAPSDVVINAISAKSLYKYRDAAFIVNGNEQEAAMIIFPQQTGSDLVLGIEVGSYFVDTLGNYIFKNVFIGTEMPGVAFNYHTYSNGSLTSTGRPSPYMLTKFNYGPKILMLPADDALLGGTAAVTDTLMDQLFIMTELVGEVDNFTFISEPEVFRALYAMVTDLYVYNNSNVPGVNK
nr:putative capsid protein [Picobirnavirus sp.]